MSGPAAGWAAASAGSTLFLPSGCSVVRNPAVPGWCTVSPAASKVSRELGR
ncbi:MAG: hypothetical protein ACRDN0_35565 [Trebonia sp.]